MLKRRSTSNERPESKCKRTMCCIIHRDNSNMASFIHLNDLENPGERFRYICEIRRKRLSQPIGSAERMEAMCDQIPEEFGEIHGYHRDCYQRFTMNLNRLKQSATGKSNERRKSTRIPSKTELVRVKPKCIFCNGFGRKKIKKGNSWTTEGLSNFQSEEGESILKLAEDKGDEALALQVLRISLFSKKARYHATCRRKYSNPSVWQSKDATAKEFTRQRQEAHDSCFKRICEFLDEKVLIRREVVLMTQLRDLYIQYLSKTPFAKPNYQTRKLKSRLLHHEIYSQRICFIHLDRSGGKFQSDILFSNDTSLSEAVKNGYMLGCCDMLKDVGEYLHNIIKESFKKSDLHWPPTASYLQTVENPVPQELQKFLRILICGQGPQLSEKTERLVSSIGQDQC